MAFGMPLCELKGDHRLAAAGGMNDRRHSLLIQHPLRRLIGIFIVPVKMYAHPTASIYY